MRARLQNKLQFWKARLRGARKELRRVRDQLRWSAHRQKKLEARVAELEEITNPKTIAGHTYPAQMVLLAVFMVAQAGVSLRGAAKTVGFFAKMMGWSHKTPSHVTVLRWVLRAGLYELNRLADKRHGNYVGILDESISLGGEKLLLLLGVKMLPGGTTALGLLNHADVEVLAMQVSPSWKAEQIAEFLQDKIGAAPAGVNLDYVVSDGGTNIVKALRQRKVDRVADCTHLLMNLVKKWYAADERLGKFCSQVGTLRRQNILGKYGYIVPATLRDKDRFLRIFNLVDWVAKIDAAWERLDPEAKSKLSFLNSSRELITELVQVRQFVAQTAKIFKRRGMNERSIELWEWLLKRWLAQQPHLAPSIDDMIESVRRYLETHQILIDKHGSLLCYSDVIESVFGRYKNKGGVKAISADVLKIPLYGVDLTLDFITEALITVSYQEVYKWETKNTCPTRFGQIRSMRNQLKPVKTAA
jgi:hypothetical protein